MTFILEGVPDLQGGCCHYASRGSSEGKPSQAPGGADQSAA